MEPDIHAWRLNKTVKLMPREHSWVGPFSMLYIDNLVGVGYSFTEDSRGIRENRKLYTRDLNSAVQQFYRLFPHLNTTDLYIGGQSYAAKYVITLAYRIHRRNTKLSKLTKPKLPLKGVYLGGPFYDGNRQGRALYKFLFSIGWIGKSELEKGRSRVDELFRKFRNQEHIESMSVYESLFNHPMQGISGSMDNFVTNRGMDLQLLAAVAGSRLVREAAHIGEGEFKDIIVKQFSEGVRPDVLVNSRRKMAALMDHYKVLVYNGDFDLIVSSASVEAALLRTQWAGLEAYKKCERKPWYLGGGVGGRSYWAGFYSVVGRFCRVVVHGAGHQAPRDRPSEVRRMMEDFVQHGCVKQRVGSWLLGG